VTDLDARCFIKKGNSLVPADFAAEEFLDGIPSGREILVSVRRARSPQHHRWFFALLRKVVDNTDRWASEEELLDDLKIACGHVTKRVNILTGEVSLVARSINFASLPEDPFRRFKDRALFVLGKVLGVDPLSLMDEVEATQRPVGVASPPTAPTTRRRRAHRKREKEPA
jgi:hypothetical protein